jgi:hypothetical protein
MLVNFNRLTRINEVLLVVTTRLQKCTYDKRLFSSESPTHLPPRTFSLPLLFQIKLTRIIESKVLKKSLSPNLVLDKLDSSSSFQLLFFVFTNQLLESRTSFSNLNLELNINTMAVLDAVPGLVISVLVNGNPLHEYPDEEEAARLASFANFKTIPVFVEAIN